MASGAKRKTTMAKLNREHRLRERRMEKQARKDARKLAAAQDPEALDAVPTAEATLAAATEAAPDAPDAVVHPTDA
jgi:hypothetical protein